MIVFSDNLFQFHHVGMVQLLKCLVGQKYKYIFKKKANMLQQTYQQCSKKSAPMITIHTFTSLRFIHSSHE